MSMAQGHSEFNLSSAVALMQSYFLTINELRAFSHKNYSEYSSTEPSTSTANSRGVRTCKSFTIYGTRYDSMNRALLAGLLRNFPCPNDATSAVTVDISFATVGRISELLLRQVGLP